MLFARNHSEKTRRSLRAVIARVMALVLLFSLLAPHSAPADVVLNFAAQIMISTEGAETQPGERAEYDVVKHASCACHVGLPAQSAATMFVCLDFDAAYIAQSDTQPRPGPASLPFKPPRA